jgi:streptogramin lyase
VFVLNATGQGTGTLAEYSESGTTIKSVTGVDGGRIAVDASENVYETHGYQVTVVYANGNPSLVWGSNNSLVGRIGSIGSIACGPDGNVYVGDTVNQQVSVFTPAGAFVRSWNGNGKIQNPADMRFDTQGRLWIADGNQIDVFDAYGNYLTTVGTSGTNPGQFSGPSLSVDNAGNLYEADSNTNRLQKFEPCGSINSPTPTVTLVATPCVAYASSVTDGALGNPVGLGVDIKGLVYVTGHNASSVLVFDGNENLQRQWSTAGYVDGLRVSPSCHVYVGGDSPAEIVKYDLYGNVLGVFGTGKTAWRLALDANENIYATDANYKINVYTSQGSPVTSWGNYGNFVGQMFNIAGIAVGPDGNVYVGDTGNQRIDVYTPNGVFVRTWNGSGKVQSPTDMNFDSQGRLWIADTNQINVFDEYGDYLASFGGTGNSPGLFNTPYFTLDSLGNMYEGDFWTNSHKHINLYADLYLYANEYAKLYAYGD